MKKLGQILHPLRAAAVLLVSLIIKSTVTTSIYSMAADPNSGIYELPNFAIHLLCLLATVLSFSSFSRVANNHFNPGACEEYTYRRRDTDGFFAELRAIAVSREYILEAVIYTVGVGALALLGAYPEGSGSLGSGVRALSLLLIPIFLVINLFSKYEAHRYWLALKLTGNLEAANSILRRVFQTLLLLIMYPTLFPYVPYLLYTVFSLIGVFTELAKILSVIGLIVAIICAVLLFYGLSIVNAWRKRKKFLARLKRVADENGYSLEDVYSPISSMINPSAPRPSFVLRREKKVYICKLIPTLHRGTYLYLTSKSTGYFRHRLGTKNHHFTLNHQISFPMGDSIGGTEILIVNPIPKHLFAEEFGTSKEIVAGERLWGSVIYDGGTFLGCLDRDCLDRGMSMEFD